MHIDMKDAQELALRTWYIGDDNIDFDTQLQNAVMGLIGEAGEIVDVCKKISHKPGVTMDDMRDKLIEELGDYWYYFRIFYHLLKIESVFYHVGLNDGLGMLALSLAIETAGEVSDVTFYGYGPSRAGLILGDLIDMIAMLDITIDELTQLNYAKLSGGKHGWPEHE